MADGWFGRGAKSEAQGLSPPIALPGDRSATTLQRGIQDRQIPEVAAKKTAIAGDEAVGMELSVCGNEEVGDDAALPSPSRKMSGESLAGQCRALPGRRDELKLPVGE